MSGVGAPPENLPDPATGADDHYDVGPPPDITGFAQAYSAFLFGRTPGICSPISASTPHRSMQNRSGSALMA
jgi:hypothetical protein